jgi:hypothetical protein
MTGAEWDACADPSAMLAYLGPEASNRKLRLFACAYARTGSWLEEFSRLCISHFYDQRRQKPSIDPQAAQADLLALRRMDGGGRSGYTFAGQPPLGDEGEALVALAEACADGLRSPRELAEALLVLDPKRQNARLGAAYCGPSAHRPAEQLDLLAATLAASGSEAATEAVAAVSHYFVAIADSGPRRRQNPEFREPVRRQTFCLQADLLREIFGNPFHPVAVDAAWRGWNNGTIVRLAQAAYEERQLPCGLLDNARLAVLADALEEAGCASARILEHLRGRQQCSWCQGQPTGIENFRGVALWVDECSNCGGTGWTSLETEHVRGCHMLDAILAKS